MCDETCTCEGLRSCFSASEVLPHKVCAPSTTRLCLVIYSKFRFLEYSWNFMSCPCKCSTTIRYLAGNLLLNMALWYFSSPAKKSLGQKKLLWFCWRSTWHSDPPVTSLSSLILIILKGSQSPHSPSYLHAGTRKYCFFFENFNKILFKKLFDGYTAVVLAR